MKDARKIMDKKAVADAKRFFRREAYSGWGYLIRERKERTPLEDMITEAQRTYWQGIRSAWTNYTSVNEIVKKAKETLDNAIQQASELLDKSDGSARAKKLFFKAVLQAHADYAETVAPIWKAFVKDMEKKY